MDSATMTPVENRANLPPAGELAGLVGAVADRHDRQAFAVLYRLYAPRLKSWGIRLGLRSDEAEELAQETMLSVWRKAALFDPAKAGASTWIFTIARNLFIDGKRRGTRAPGGADIDLSILPDDADTPEQVTLAADRERRVRDALSRLSPDQQAVIRLSYFSETPQTEIAEALGIPLGTVKSRVRLAVDRLRSYLDEYR